MVQNLTLFPLWDGLHGGHELKDNLELVVVRPRVFYLFTYRLF